MRIFDFQTSRTRSKWQSLQTCRGSHTHTLVLDPNDKDDVYIYVSGTSFVRQAEELAGCSGEKPDKDPNTALFRIDVIKVPLAAPQDAKVVSSPRVFIDPRTGALNGLNNGGSHGKGEEKPSDTNQCHDLTSVLSRMDWLQERALEMELCWTLKIPYIRSAWMRKRSQLFVLALGFVSKRWKQGGIYRRMGGGLGGAVRMIRTSGARCDLPLEGRKAEFRVLQDAGSRATAKTVWRTTVRCPRCPAAISKCKDGTRAACRLWTSRIRCIRSRSRTSTADRSIRRC